MNRERLFQLLRSLLMIIAFLFASMPVAFVLTVLTWPFWSYIEANYGIESIGHSGPAEWCFEVVYVFVVCTGLALLYRGRSKVRRR